MCMKVITTTHITQYSHVNHLLFDVNSTLFAFSQSQSHCIHPCCDTIRYGIFACAQKLTKSQLNLAHGTRNGENKEN